MSSLRKQLKRVPKPFNSILENGNKADYFVGLSVEKPEKLSPMEMELRIQADRVIFSLNKAISVLSVMAHLPLLLNNQGELLRENLTSKELAFVLFVLQSYEAPELHALDLDNIAPPSNSPHHNHMAFGLVYDMINNIKSIANRSVTTVVHDRLDANLTQVIDMLFTNKCIRHEIRTARHSMVIPYFMKFIRDFEDLRDMAKIKLYVTGTEEEARERKLRQAYKTNLMLTAAIKDLEQQLDTQRDQLGKELNSKIDVFKKYNEKIDRIREEFQISIEKNIHESEKKMMHQCLQSEERQAILQVEADNITKQFQQMLDDHIVDEKSIRIKTNKTQSQLMSWIVKYDQDMTEKFEEHEGLKTQFAKEKAGMDELADQMDDQDDVYDVAMKEKQEEEDRVYNEMAYRLLMNRCARIIQKEWRDYKERKSKKKRRGKRGKDGKKGQGKK